MVYPRLANARQIAFRHLPILLALAGLWCTGLPAWAQDPPPLSPLASPTAPIESLDEAALLRLLGDRVRLNISDADAGELIDTSAVITPPHFTGDEYWRRSFGLAIDVLPSGPLTLNLHGGSFDARTPQTTAFGSLPISEISGWTEHEAKDVGVKLGLFGDRLRYAAGYSWSDYAAESEASFVDVSVTMAESGDEAAIAAPGDGRGRAKWHRVDAAILEGGAFDLSAYGLYSLVDPSYRAVESSAAEPSEESFAPAPGETREVGGAIDFVLVRVSLSQGILANTVEGIEGDSTTRTYTTGADIELTLDQYHYFAEEGDGDGPWRLLPTSIRLSGSRSQFESPGAGDDPDDLETSLGFGLSWEWGNADTSIDVWQSFYDSRAIGFETADSEDLSVEVSQSFYGERWDLSAYLSINRYAYMEVESPSLDTSFGGGADFSLRPERLPDISVSLYVDRYDSSYSDYDYVYSSRSQSLSFDLGLDFSKYLPVVQSNYEPYLRLNYHGERTRDRDSDLGESTDQVHGGTVSMGLQF